MMLNIIGIAVLTTNVGGQSGQDIGALWQNFFANNMAAKIPGAIHPEIQYMIYMDYDEQAQQTNALQGKYRTILGVQAPHTDKLPAGMVQVQIPAHKYEKFALEGPVPQVVVDLWMKVWSGQLKLNRAFAPDYQVHYPAKDGHGKVDVFISVK